MVLNNFYCLRYKLAHTMFVRHPIAKLYKKKMVGRCLNDVCVHWFVVSVRKAKI
jgi:hypothetical protein